MFSFMGTRGRRQSIDWVFSSRVFFSVVESENAINSHGMAGLALLSRVSQTAWLWGSDPFRESQPSLIQRRAHNLNLGSGFLLP